MVRNLPYKLRRKPSSTRSNSDKELGEISFVLPTPSLLLAVRLWELSTACRDGRDPLKYPKTLGKERNAMAIREKVKKLLSNSLILTAQLCERN